MKSETHMRTDPQKDIRSTAGILPILATILLFFSSCGVVHKLFAKTKTDNSTNTLHTSDSTGLKKLDQLSSAQKDSASLKKTSEQNNAGVEVIFSDTSQHNQVEVTVGQHGQQIIKASGSIQSVKTKGVHAAQSQDSVHTSTGEAAFHTSIDSSKTKTQMQTATQNSVKTVTSQKTSRQLPWYGYIILLIIVLLTVLYWRYRKNLAAWYHRLPG